MLVLAPLTPAANATKSVKSAKDLDGEEEISILTEARVPLVPDRLGFFFVAGAAFSMVEDRAVLFPRRAEVGREGEEQWCEQEGQ